MILKILDYLKIFESLENFEVLGISKTFGILKRKFDSLLKLLKNLNS